MEAARPATEADVARLASLAREARAELAPTRGGDVFVTREARGEPLEAGFVDELSDPGVIVLCGTIDDVVIGYGAGRVETLPDGRRLGRITDLFVEAEARGVAVGERLMADLLAWFAERRCFGVDAIALPGARETKNFFEASGFSARLLVMHHRFAAGDQ